MKKYIYHKTKSIINRNETEPMLRYKPFMEKYELDIDDVKAIINDFVVNMISEMRVDVHTYNDGLEEDFKSHFSTQIKDDILRNHNGKQFFIPNISTHKDLNGSIILRANYEVFDFNKYNSIFRPEHSI